MRLRAALLPFVAVFALLLSGCGGDDTSDDTTTTTSPTSDSEDAAESPDGDDSTADEPDGDDPEFCTAFDDFQTAMGQVPPDIESIKTVLAEASEEVTKVVAAAPDELSDEVDTFADFIGQLRDAADGATTQEEFGEASSELAQSAEFGPASSAIQTWISENCTPAAG